MTMTDPTLSLVAVNAGLGDPSSTRLLIDRLADAAVDEFGADRVTVEVVDLRDLAVDIARSMISGFVLGDAREAIALVHEADGLVVATPVFNASYSGLFKSFFDLVEVDRIQGKPVLVAATGGSPRHSMVLDHAIRPLFSYLRAVVVPTGVYAAAEDWAGTSGDTAQLSDRIRRAAAELAAAMRAARPDLRTDRGAAVGDRTTAATGADATRTALEAEGIANFAKLLGDNA